MLQVGCEKEITVLLQNSGFSSVDEFQAEFCTNNFFEMLAVVHVYMKGKIHTNYQDLFLEQRKFGIFWEHFLSCDIEEDCFKAVHTLL